MMNYEKQCKDENRNVVENISMAQEDREKELILDRFYKSPVTGINRETIFLFEKSNG